MPLSRHPPLVGRAAHLARAVAVLDLLETGIGGVLLLVGDAGHGTSRMAGVVADQATARGARVAWSRPAVSGPADTPLGTWERALRRLTGTRPWSSAPTDLDHAAAVVRDAVADGPTVLVLDDLHRADDRSRWLVGHLLDDLGDLALLVIAVMRPGQTSDEEPTWGHHAACTRVRLDALPDADIALLLDHLAGTGTGEEPIDIDHPLVHLAGGVPATAVRLAEEWAGTLGRQRLLDRIAAHVETHNPAGILTVLAALERPCTPAFHGNAKLTTIAATAQVDVDAAIESLHRAESAGITRRVAEGRRWAMRHPLLADAALADPVRTATTRARLGEALLVAEAEEGSGVVSAECAGQFVLAGRPRADVTWRAARWLLDVGQPAQARDLVAATVTTALPEDDQIALNRLAGIANAALGNHYDAEDYLTAMVNRARVRGQVAVLADTVADLLTWVPAVPDQARSALIAEALALLPQLPQPVAARLQATAAHALVHLDSAQAVTLWQAAVDADQEAVRADVLALPALHGCQAEPAQIADAVAALSGLEQRHGRGRALAAVGELSLSLIRGTREEIVRALARLEDAVAEWPAPELAAYGAVAQLALARFDADPVALARLTASRAWLQAPPRSHPALLLGVGHLLWRQALGGIAPLPDAAARAARVVPVRSQRSLDLTALGITAVEGGDLGRQLRDRFDAVGADPDALPRDFRWVGDLVAIAAFAGAAGNIELARRAADLLTPQLEEMAVVLPTGVSGPIGLHVGHARLAAGDVPAAAAAVDAALRCCERTGARSWEALTRVLQARLALAEQRPADARQALEATRRLTAGATMPRVAEAVDRVAAQVEAVEKSAAVRLSGREREVLQLVATGATNRQVARSLGISPKTVEYHLAGVYRMLGAANRVEAVEVARHTGLL